MAFHGASMCLAIIKEEYEHLPHWMMWPGTRGASAVLGTTLGTQGGCWPNSPGLECSVPGTILSPLLDWKALEGWTWCSWSSVFPAGQGQAWTRNLEMPPGRLPACSSTLPVTATRGRPGYVQSGCRPWLIPSGPTSS